ncbi:GNAT family N-acetyltransferase [Sphingomonas sp. HITSZ_GF]|uniref:GNAT family N-acetyltransferase n=1 Tax=Sphingomonas sp. HITSZ_GF TaxID=3037247 RepID=UPI00240D4390|nr:GNAT family N-acetyltransferase [Sphingomonas sp. HITSZ_GF]MDG2534590.1 GNAT family N-acetyltransferase [Sphingomonas sp. HITSZ_GF]
MIYRDATIDDLPAIDTLFRASFIATFGHLYRPQDLAGFLGKFTPAAWAREFAEPGLAFHLAEDEQGLAGFAKVSRLTLPAETSARTYELRQLYLDERAKGSGAAQVLMDWALDRGRAAGAEEMWLSVYVDNHRARRFYEKNGFEDRGPYVFLVGSHEDEDRLMRRAL